MFHLILSVELSTVEKSTEHPTGGVPTPPSTEDLQISSPAISEWHTLARQSGVLLVMGEIHVMLRIQLYTTS